MIRGTTSSLKLITDKNWDGWRVWVTIEDKTTELTLKEDRVIVEGNTVVVNLSQEETLMFTSSSANVQVKGEKDGNVEATLMGKVKVYPILCEDVM